MEPVDTCYELYHQDGSILVWYMLVTVSRDPMMYSATAVYPDALVHPDLGVDDDPESPLVGSSSHTEEWHLSVHYGTHVSESQ